MSSKASPTVLISLSSSSATSMSKVSSRAMTSSTRSRLSEPRSSPKEASRVTCAGSTAKTSTVFSVNFAKASLRSMVLPLFLSLHRSQSSSHTLSLDTEREPPVDHDDGARDVASVVTGEKPDNASDIGRLADVAERNHRRHGVSRRAELTRHVGVDQARRHDVHGDRARGHLFRERASQSDEARFSGGVVRLARHAHKGRDRADKDDRTRTNAEPGGHGRARAVKGPVEVRTQHVTPLFV